MKGKAEMTEDIVRKTTTTAEPKSTVTEVDVTTIRTIESILQKGPPSVWVLPLSCDITRERLDNPRAVQDVLLEGQPLAQLVPKPSREQPTTIERTAPDLVVGAEETAGHAVDLEMKVLSLAISPSSLVSLL